MFIVISVLFHLPVENWGSGPLHCSASRFVCDRKWVGNVILSLDLWSEGSLDHCRESDNGWDLPLFFARCVMAGVSCALGTGDAESQRLHSYNGISNVECSWETLHRHPTHSFIRTARTVEQPAFASRHGLSVLTSPRTPIGRSPSSARFPLSLSASPTVDPLHTRGRHRDIGEFGDGSGQEDVHGAPGIGGVVMYGSPRHTRWFPPTIQLGRMAVSSATLLLG